MHSGNTNATKAFATQYTSLVLILLTFVLGAFSAPPAASPSSPTIALERPLHTFGALEYRDLFAGGRINTSQLDPLLIVLRNHDLEVGLKVTVAPGRISTGIEQVKLLREFLLSEGIPDGAYLLEVEESHIEGLGVRFLTEEG